MPCGMAVWPAPIDPISPGAKQVTRPLAASLNAEGQSPPLTALPSERAVYSFPSPLPATPTTMPGMS